MGLPNPFTQWHYLDGRGLIADALTDVPERRKHFREAWSVE